jgi:nitroreductase
MIAQGAMTFNSRRSPTAYPYGVPQILVTLISFQGEARQAASTELAALYAAQYPDLSHRTLETLAKLSRLFTHTPLVVAVISKADPNARKPEWEQVLTVGAVCMNLITAATALGYASVWLTG